MLSTDDIQRITTLVQNATDESTDAHYFGLGFIQVKLDQLRRVHLYHPSLEAYVETPHTHRYPFVSKVLLGSLCVKMWEQCAYWEGNGVWASQEDFQRDVLNTNVGIESVSCAATGGREIHDQYTKTLRSTGSIQIHRGSSYYQSMETFHTVVPDFNYGPCVTLLTRTLPKDEYALTAVLPGTEPVCPFSKKLSSGKMWAIVKECLDTIRGLELTS